MLKLYRKDFKAGKMKVADRRPVKDDKGKPVKDKKGKETGEMEVYHHYLTPQDMSLPERMGKQKYDEEGEELERKSLPAKNKPLSFTDEEYALEHCQFLYKD